MLKKNYTVRLVKLNWDKECASDLNCNKGFIIDEEPFTKINGVEEKNVSGIYSPLFATDYDDEEGFKERYSCRCGKLQGRVHEGENCPNCGTKVKFIDVDLKLFGWMKLQEYYIIQPIYYKMIESVIGEKVFNEIIEYDRSIDSDGVVGDKKSKNPFYGIGLINFKNRFYEIMAYFKKTKRNKKELIDQILFEYDSVFAKSIPVFSTILRPDYFKNESYFFSSMNKKYNSMYYLIMLLNNPSLIDTRNIKRDISNKERLDEHKIVYNIQKKMMELWEMIFLEINQKEGHIRDEILGGRINFSSRCVIIPDPELKADEIKINYTAFLELFKFEIIAHITKINNISQNEAYEQWYKAAINFNPKIYEIMNFILKKRKPKVIINRNPSINYGSLLCMKIVEIKHDNMEDYSMSIPIQILNVMNADFDGDVLNIVSLKLKRVTKKFNKAFNPTLNMFVSRSDGLFNGEFNLIKDQLIGLSQFNNI